MPMDKDKRKKVAKFGLIKAMQSGKKITKEGEKKAKDKIKGKLNKSSIFR